MLRLRAGFALTLVLAILGLAGCAPPAIQLAGPLPGPTATAATPPVAPDANWYHVYFTQPAVTAKQTDSSGGIPDQLAASFDAAGQTIDLAIYQFDLMPLAEALLRAKARGVRLRVVTDSDSLEMDGIQALAQAGVPVVPDSREPLMHNKFAVVDGAIVWTGSMNYTFNDAYRNDNNVIKILSSLLAQNYTRVREDVCE